MTVGELGESGLLELLLPHLRTSGFPISAGEDDAACWRSREGFLVASTDTQVEGVHFDLAWMPAEAAGWRALALALGDLAAKGAVPEIGLISAALPAAWAAENVVDLYRGLRRLADEVGLSLLGGDTSATGGPALINLTVIGSTPRPPLPRSRARPGWSVGVTGPLGAAGLALRDQRVLRPRPLLTEGRRLNELGLCCGDISDGLYREMEKFAVVSGAGARIWRDRIPLSPGADWELALASGEEAELVCVGPAELVQRAGLQVIGELTGDGEVLVLDPEGRSLPVHERGHRHFG